ncbi:4-hydroxythreonine-4-phosphate dehydrogenase [Opitutaceae bacterium TAV4]|nr:4-hydroxythreonine-4-phosphate dehydrogenase [Opitutaceae bacterium TAV4]
MSASTPFSQSQPHSQSTPGARAPLAFTCGDPAGVGPEIIAAWLAQHPDEYRDVAVIGPRRWLDSLPASIAKIVVGGNDFVATSGQPTEAGAAIAWDAMERAAAGCLNGKFSGVVTGPISKAWLARVGYKYPGQTEFFADRWRSASTIGQGGGGGGGGRREWREERRAGEPVMAFAGGRLRVVLHTWHIPLRAVAAELTLANFTRSIRAADELARVYGCEREHPRIGVCGLNPHAGEEGLLGNEERDVIDPILDTLRAQFPGLSRSEPGDTLFGRQLRGEFDVVVALYHDQGLAPLKVIDFDESVNITLGLAHVRTSPDHGTAFGIAGQGKASIRSFANAVTVARRLIRARATKTLCA